MIRRPPRSTLDRSSAASDVYKRQLQELVEAGEDLDGRGRDPGVDHLLAGGVEAGFGPGSYTHLRAHETVLDLVCRLLLEKKKKRKNKTKKKKKKKKRKNKKETLMILRRT